MQSAETAYIYALCEPDHRRTVRYVGKSIDPDARYLSHIDSADKAKEAKLPKARWLKKLRSKGLSPTIEILELCNEDTWRAAEKAWIAYFRDISDKELLNVSDGGELICRRRNYIGERFGRLTVVSYSEAPGLVDCVCTCGAAISIDPGRLVSRNTSSCGCLRREVTSRRARKAHVPIQKGERFGRLTVVRRCRKRSGGHIQYEVLCDCGNTKRVAASDLRNGKVVSCKCFHKERISELMREVRRRA